VLLLLLLNTTGLLLVLWLVLWLVLRRWRPNTHKRSKGSTDAYLAPVVGVTRGLQAYAVIRRCWDKDAPQCAH
jgi:hypothetical protein